MCHLKKNHGVASLILGHFKIKHGQKWAKLNLYYVCILYVWIFENNLKIND